jgi:hypothetical protein
MIIHVEERVPIRGTEERHRYQHSSKPVGRNVERKSIPFRLKEQHDASVRRVPSPRRRKA